MISVLLFVAFVAWSALWIGLFLLFLPFATLVHELGHACVVLLVTRSQARIRIGQGPLVWDGRLGRVELRYHRFDNPRRVLFWDVLNVSFGFVQLPSLSSWRWRRALLALAGPAASLLLSYCCARLALAMSLGTLWSLPVVALCAIAAVLAGLQGMINLFPWRSSFHGGVYSDGWIALHAVFVRTQPQPTLPSIFNSAALATLAGAQDAAQQAGHACVATEHLLLALLADPRGPARRAVDALGDADHTCALVAGIETVEPDDTGQMTRHAKAAIEAATGVAISMGRGRIGTLDLLVGLAMLDEGHAAKVLAAAGITPDALQQYARRTPTSEDSSLAFYWSNPVRRTRTYIRSALMCATLIPALELVGGYAPIFLSVAALALLFSLSWTLKQLHAGARPRVYAGLCMAGGISLTLTAITLRRCIDTEIAILHAVGEDALLHDRSFLVLAGYAVFGVSTLFLVGGAALLARKFAQADVLSV